MTSFFGSGISSAAQYKFLYYKYVEDMLQSVQFIGDPREVSLQAMKVSV